MKFDTKIYSELSKIQQSVQNINELLHPSNCYYSWLLNESLRVKGMLKRINTDKNISEDLRSKINDCWYVLEKACEKLI